MNPLNIFGNFFFNNPNSKFQDFNVRRFESDSNVIHSDWAEVAYFLGPHDNFGNTVKDGDTNGDSSNGKIALPYYTLYRQQKVVLPKHNISNVNTDLDYNTYLPQYNTDSFSDISHQAYEYSAPQTMPIVPSKQLIRFNSPSDLTIPWKRMGNRNFDNLGSQKANKALFSEFGNASPKAFTDILATNVISFDVKLLTDNYYDYEDLFTIVNRLPYTNHLAVTNYSPHAVFDTWTNDQGGVSYSGTPLPVYDFGIIDGSTSKWRPTSSQKSNDKIPIWDWTNGKGLLIKSIQISIRVWDQKSNSAKMFVVVQKL